MTDFKVILNHLKRCCEKPVKNGLQFNQLGLKARYFRIRELFIRRLQFNQLGLKENHKQQLHCGNLNCSLTS